MSRLEEVTAGVAPGTMQTEADGFTFVRRKSQKKAPADVKNANGRIGAAIEPSRNGYQSRNNYRQNGKSDRNFRNNGSSKYNGGAFPGNNGRVATHVQRGVSNDLYRSKSSKTPHVGYNTGRGRPRGEDAMFRQAARTQKGATRANPESLRSKASNRAVNDNQRVHSKNKATPPGLDNIRSPVSPLKAVYSQPSNETSPRVKADTSLSSANVITTAQNSISRCNSYASTVTTPTASLTPRAPKSWAEALGSNRKTIPVKSKKLRVPPPSRPCIPSALTPTSSNASTNTQTVDKLSAGHPSLRVSTKQSPVKGCSNPVSTVTKLCEKPHEVEVHKSESSDDTDVPPELAILLEAPVRRPWGERNGSRGPSTSHAHKRIEPLGFRNPHNLCFFNAQMQGFLATRVCQEFMKDLHNVLEHIPAYSEVLLGLARLAHEMHFTTDAALSLEPIKKIVEVYNKYEGFVSNGDESPFSVARAQAQLDAAGVYATTVDLISQELRVFRQRLAGENDLLSTSGENNSEWKMQTRKGNASIQGMGHVTEQRCTPFAEAMRGLTAASYRNATRSSVTLEPFSMLIIRPHEIGPDSVEEGLSRLFEKTVDDSRERGVHQTLLHELPKVLVINVARFKYDQLYNTMKVMTPVHHPLVLETRRDWFDANAPVKHATYHLVAKVVHHGERATFGHYTTMALRSSQWWHCDDSRVTPASLSDVKEPDAYLLFYELE